MVHSLPRDEQSPERWAQVDFFRGLALILICLDHIEGNWFGRLTPRALGYADMAEAFVFLSGLVSGLSFRRRASAHGVWPAVWHFWKRAVYLTLIYVLVGTVLVGLIDWLNVESMLGASRLLERPRTISLELAWRMTIFQQEAGPLGILPVYLWCLAVVPLLWAITAAWPAQIQKRFLWGVTLGGYLAVQMGGLGGAAAIPAALYYHPVAWQSLFLLGGLCGEWHIPESWKRGLTVLSLIILFGLLTLAGSRWALSHSLKPTLGSLRLVHFLSWVWLLSQLITTEFARQWPWICRCGRHSLGVFVGGAFLSVVLSWWLIQISRSWVDQLMVNVAGCVGCLVLAVFAERFQGALGWDRTGTRPGVQK